MAYFKKFEAYEKPENEQVQKVVKFLQRYVIESPEGIYETSNYTSIELRVGDNSDVLGVKGVIVFVDPRRLKVPVGSVEKLNEKK